MKWAIAYKFSKSSKLSPGYRPTNNTAIFWISLLEFHKTLSSGFKNTEPVINMEYILIKK